MPWAYTMVHQGSLPPFSTELGVPKAMRGFRPWTPDMFQDFYIMSDMEALPQLLSQHSAFLPTCPPFLFCKTTTAILACSRGRLSFQWWLPHLQTKRRQHKHINIGTKSASVELPVALIHLRGLIVDNPSAIMLKISVAGSRFK